MSIILLLKTNLSKRVSNSENKDYPKSNQCGLMEGIHPPKEVEETTDDTALPEKEDNSELPDQEVISDKWLLEKIDSLIPLIKEKWPNIAQQTLEATKGSIDDLVEVIASIAGPQ